MRAMLLVLALIPLGRPAARTLDIWVVDTEGGKAVLLRSPSGESMLIDSGYPGHGDRDTNRILEAAKAAGVGKLDVLVTTHYDLDHVGNTPPLAARIPVLLFVDHGPALAEGPAMAKRFADYAEVAGKARRLSVRPGDRVPFPGLDVLVVASGGQVLKRDGSPNSVCEGTPPKQPDASENAASLGLLFTYGKFRMADFGDLSWNKELELMCPVNPIGVVDLLMVSYHGGDPANSPALVHALRPKVTIMNNGARKMGSPEVLKTIRSSPGLQAAYQVHWSVNAPDDNPPAEFIANLPDSPDGRWIQVSAQESGAFTVTNARTGLARTFGHLP